MMTFETSKYVKKTEKHCCVFKDNRIKNIIKIAFSFDEKRAIDSIDIEMYIEWIQPLIIQWIRNN